MSRRTSIVKAFATKFKEINGTSPYAVNLFNNSYPDLKFWDEVNDFPAVYLTAGTETREYHPAEFSWGFLNVCVKLYCQGETSNTELENLLEDVERLIDGLDGRLIYDSSKGYETSELSITSITTDEGLLRPYAVGEINLLVRYQIMK